MLDGLIKRFQAHKAQNQAVLLFLALNIILLIVGVQGFEHGRLNNFHDQSIQIPMIYSFEDSTVFPDDFLLDARDTYVTWFYPVIGWLSRVIPLEALMAGLYVLSTAATLGGVYMLATTLFKRREVGFIAVVMWMAYFPNPGGDFIHSPFVTHTTFSIAIELWALVLFFRKRYAWAGFLIGLALNINAMTGVFVATMCVFALLSTPRQWSWRLVRFPVVLGIAALPTLIWRFTQPLEEAALDDFVEIIRLRLWYAVFPTEMNPGLWVGFFAVLIVWWLSFRYYGKSDYHRQVVAMVLSIGALALIGTFFAEIVPLEFVIELQLVRSTWLINLLVLFYFANMLYTQLSSGDRRQAALAFVLMALFAVPRWIIELFPPSQPTPYPLEIDLDTAWHDQYPLFVALIIGFSTLSVVWMIWRWMRKENKDFTVDQTRPVVLWFGMTIIFFTLPALINSKVPDKQVRITEDWETATIWIREHTPEDAYFFTPPTLDGFRIEAKRTSLGNWKDGTVGIFQNEWVLEWRTRMLDMGLDEDEFEFEPMTQDRLCDLLEKYDVVTHVIIFNDWEIAGESLYINNTFTVMPETAVLCPEAAS
ncbi:MAG: hypothetical protein K8S97_04100 [Anaerolineae bacterium]|nr:hypothetical protein [Anaerolineae bacterium]